MRRIHKGVEYKEMMTANNLFTFIRKYGAQIKRMGCPPPFYRQVFDLTGKTFAPFDELKSRAKEAPLRCLVPHFFIDDSKQSCFVSNPFAHSDILDEVYAVISTDYSVYLDVPDELNNAVIFMNRFVASMWQQQGRYVILSVTWSGKDTYHAAFDNIEKGCAVSVSTCGVKNWNCFANGFKEMLLRIQPNRIYWYSRIPNWVYDVYPLENIVILEPRHKRAKRKTANEIISLFDTASAA